MADRSSPVVGVAPSPKANNTQSTVNFEDLFDFSPEPLSPPQNDQGTGKGQ